MLADKFSFACEAHYLQRQSDPCFDFLFEFPAEWYIILSIIIIFFVVSFFSWLRELAEIPLLPHEVGKGLPMPWRTRTRIWKRPAQKRLAL